MMVEDRNRIGENGKTIWRRRRRRERGRDGGRRGKKRTIRSVNNKEGKQC